MFVDVNADVTTTSSIVSELTSPDILELTKK